MLSTCRAWNFVWLLLLKNCLLVAPNQALPSLNPRIYQLIHQLIQSRLLEARLVQNKSAYRINPWSNQKDQRDTINTIPLSRAEIDKFIKWYNNDNSRPAINNNFEDHLTKGNIITQRNINKYTLHLMKTLYANWKDLSKLSAIEGDEVRGFDSKKLENILIDMAELFRLRQYSDVGLLIYKKHDQYVDNRTYNCSQPTNYNDSDDEKYCPSIADLAWEIFDKVYKNTQATIYKGNDDNSDEYEGIRQNPTTTHLHLKKLYDECLRNIKHYVDPAWNINNATKKIQALYRGHSVRRNPPVTPTPPPSPPPSPPSPPPSPPDTPTTIHKTYNTHPKQGPSSTHFDLGNTPPTSTPTPSTPPTNSSALDRSPQRSLDLEHPQSLSKQQDVSYQLIIRYLRNTPMIHSSKGYKEAKALASLDCIKLLQAATPHKELIISLQNFVLTKTSNATTIKPFTIARYTHGLTDADRNTDAIIHSEVAEGIISSKVIQDPISAEAVEFISSDSYNDISCNLSNYLHRLSKYTDINTHSNHDMIFIMISLALYRRRKYKA